MVVSRGEVFYTGVGDHNSDWPSPGLRPGPYSTNGSTLTTILNHPDYQPLKNIDPLSTFTIIRYVTSGY